MFNFTSFAGFGKLDSLVALEAMNNADGRMLVHRTKMDSIFCQGSKAEYRAWKLEKSRLESESRHYADTWIAIRDYEARLETGTTEGAMRVEVERQCAYCLSTTGFDGWLCRSCGGC